MMTEAKTTTGKVRKYRCGNCGAWLVLTPCDPPGSAWMGGKLLPPTPFHGGQLPTHQRSQRYPGQSAHCQGSGQMPAEAAHDVPLYIESDA